MTSQRKITLTFLDEKTAKTTGWPLRYAARQLGIWPDKTNHKLHRYSAIDCLAQRSEALANIPSRLYTINKQITVTVYELAGYAYGVFSDNNILFSGSRSKP